ncbi:sulfotransferase 1C4-like [Hyposmocoma kahamanoa]|uniref:sulfotransferase 1C4-like n=1 Tax=Hyposmocoma kahamanoa TaxID=1477025 RepID=UPI000E6D6569|nr:sulfotransferase 1C4-like [Hyposmocoma kahamanoa]
MSAKFPLEIKTFTKEEQMEHEKVYKTSEFFDDFSRVGPKKYTVMRYEKDAANIYNMKLCSSNIIVNSFPRSGTTWTQELVWLIANDFDFATAKNVPLHVRFPHLEFAPEILNELSNSPKLSSQFVMTHIPLSLLPPTLLDTCKVVYVARDPRDVALSNYHLERELCRLQENVKFEEYFEVFIANLRVYCPYFEHVKEAWALRYHPNMLFIFYEHLSRDLKSVACRICDFFGKKYNEQQLDQLCDHLRFVNFKKNPAVTRQQQYNQQQEMCYFPMLYEYAQESHGRDWEWGEWNEWDQAVKEEAEDTTSMRHEEGEGVVPKQKNEMEEDQRK